LFLGGIKGVGRKKKSKRQTQGHLESVKKQKTVKPGREKTATDTRFAQECAWGGV